MRRKEENPALEPEEIASQEAYDELQAHLETKAAMEAEYTRLDGEAVKIAQRLLPYRLAGSPAAEPIQAELSMARAKRDRTRYDWHRRADALRATLDQINRETLQEFSEECIRRTEYLWRQREAAYAGADRDMDGVRRGTSLMTNWPAISEGSKQIFADRAAIEKLRDRPLREIRQAIEEADERFEHIVQNIKTLTRLPGIRPDAAACMIASSRESDQPLRLR